MANHPDCTGYINGKQINPAHWNKNYPGNPIRTLTPDEINAALDSFDCDKYFVIEPTGVLRPETLIAAVEFKPRKYKVGFFSELIRTYPNNGINFYKATQPANSTLPITKIDIIVNVGNDWYDLSDQVFPLGATGDEFAADMQQ